MSTTEWPPLFDLEATLGELEAFIGLIGHLAISRDADVTISQWLAVEARLSTLHADLLGQWKCVLAERCRESAKHRAELEALRKTRAAPGSADAIAHVEALWRMLVAVARGVLEEAGETQA